MSDSAPAAVAPGVLRRITRVVVAVLLGFALLSLFAVYPPLRILTWWLPDWQPTTAALTTLILLPLAGRLLYQVWPGRATRYLSALSFTWLGLSFAAFLIVLAAELFNLFVDLPHRPTAITLSLLVFAISVAGITNACWPRARFVALPGNAKADGRIVQLSDVHIGSRFPGLLRQLVGIANAQAPAVHVITGDLIDFRDISRDELAPLAQLNAPTVFVIGNHERYVDVDAICERLTSLGITVLRNDVTTLAPFHFLGIDDAESRTQVARVLPALERRADLYQVLLYHRPDGFEAAADAGVDLMLTGHTHNGQIVPFNFIVKRVFARIAGLYQHGNARLYVSPGSGTWGPILRLGSRSEVTVFDIG